MSAAVVSRALSIWQILSPRSFPEQTLDPSEVAQRWQVMVQYIVSRHHRDSPGRSAVMFWINKWHHSHCMDCARIATGDRIAAIKGPLGMPWMDDRRILEYRTGHDFTNKLSIMFLERQQREDMYFDLNTCCFLCVGPVALSHGHFPAAPVLRWRMRDRLQVTSLCTRTGLQKVSISQNPYRPWDTISGSYCVLVSLVSARDGLRILRGMRTLERIYLYKLVRKAITPFAVASSKACDVASIGTVRNVIYGFLRASSKPCNKRSAKKSQASIKLSARPGNEHD